MHLRSLNYRASWLRQTAALAGRVVLVGLLGLPAIPLQADATADETQRSYQLRVSVLEMESWTRARSGAPFLRGQSSIDGLVLTKTLADEALQRGLDRSPRTRIDLLRLQGNAAVARVKARLSDAIDVGDAEIDRELSEHPPQLAPRRWRLRNIFLRYGSDDPATVRERLLAIRRQVLEGASFEALAREVSQSETRWRGGLLGNVRLGTFPPAVDDAIRELQPGQVSDVLESSQGMSLLYCEEILDAVTMTEEELRRLAENRLRRQQYDSAWNSLRESLRQRGDVTILDSADGPSVRFTGARLDAESLSLVVGRAPEHAWPETWPAAWHHALDRFVVARMALLHEAEQGSGPDIEARATLLWEERRILASARLAEEVDARFEEPTEADLRQAFESTPGAYRLAPSVDLQVLRLERPEAESVAVELLTRLRAGELSFDDAARLHSIDGSAARGGRIDGLEVRQVAPRLGLDVARAVRELAVGEISELVWTENALWIVRVLAHHEERPATYAEARSDVRRRWIRDALDRLRDDWVARRLEALDIR
ncbi:MAG: peptidylprolyl isomerase [Acidobacteriota bacterium]